ncbi:MAG: outer membrane lipoprotein-sorting protein [Bacteroidales bacterium]|nr:outer membrane lipoprotein-sorting protein [Bacteroidales bacterium]
MKTIQFKMLTIGVLLLAGLTGTVNAQDATTIMKKVDDVMYAPKDMRAVNKIVLTDRNGRTDTREATIAQMGTNYRIFRFTKPASQAGISVLSLPDDVMYLYMPAFGKVRRISSSIKNQNFAGTDFSYDDMESKPLTEKYNGKLLKTEGNTYVLQLTPKSQRSAYSKVIMSVNKENFYPVEMQFYDRGNHEIKVAQYTFIKIGKYWNTEKITLKDLKKDHTTSMIMSDVKYDTGLTKNDFTVRKLQE